MKRDYKNIETKLIHSGEPKPRICGAVSIPIFQSAMYITENESTYDDIKYIRLNNTPNHIALCEKLSSLENGESAIVTSSGMAAITTSLLTVLSSGDHLLSQECLYGGTYGFITKDFASFGLEFDFIDGNNPSSWKSKLKKNTKAIYVETMTNPLLQVADLRAVIDFARENGIVSMIDNTFATPINFRAAENGFDLSIHSATKYLNGHSDIVAGVIIGKKNLIKAITHRLNHLGGSLDPHACFLLHRGLKTLSVRLRYQNESALKIARFLEGHPAVSKVNYPGLESHHDFKRASELFEGFGGMVSFEIKGGLKSALKFMGSVNLPVIAPSLGGVETLLTRPSATSHVGLTPEERQKLGIPDELIRLSVGIEKTEDIIDDFSEVLDNLK